MTRDSSVAVLAGLISSQILPNHRALIEDCLDVDLVERASLVLRTRREVCLSEVGRRSSKRADEELHRAARVDVQLSAGPVRFSSLCSMEGWIWHSSMPTVGSSHKDKLLRLSSESAWMCMAVFTCHTVRSGEAMRTKWISRLWICW